MVDNFNNHLTTALDQVYHGDISLMMKEVEKILNNHKLSQIKSTEVKSDAKLAISLKGINKYYRNGPESLHVLKDINLDIYEGELIALVGPSGSGKSTLLQLIGGLDKPTSGEIMVNDTRLANLSDRDISNYRNKTIGFVFQFFYLQPYFNIQENVEVPLMFSDIKGDARNQASIKSINEVGLSDRITHLPSQLSGGQMQRVAIARGLVNNPKILLADEPTGNLDRNTGMEIIELLKRINREQKTTMILVTHDNFIASQADRIIKLSNGQIV